MGQATLRLTRHKIPQQESAISLLETDFRQSCGQSLWIWENQYPHSNI